MDLGLTPPSHKLRPDDYSEAHELPVDVVGVHKQLRNLQNDVYGYINEVLQNAYDSNHQGISNKVRIKIGRTQSEPTLVVSDEGRKGITEDYGGSIDKFLQDMKATTEKIKRGLKRKGIGMFQYTNIAPRVIITSMDQEMIYRIPMFETPEGATAYGYVVQKPILPKYIDEFGIHNPGTIVAFHGTDPNAPKITEKKLIENIREKWALRLFESPEIGTYVGDQEVTLVPWIKEHPPRFIQRMVGGHDIRGNIWKDEKGNGRLKLFQDGYLVEIVQFEPRQCSGYLEIMLETNAGRTAFLKDNERWYEVRRRINNQLMRFPPIQQEAQDERHTKKVLDLAQNILVLNKAPTAFGGATEITKTDAKGDRHASEVVGYPISGKPDPQRTIIERIGTEIRNPENQTRVGSIGPHDVKKTGQEKGKRKEFRALEFQENQHIGSDRPLFCLYRDRKPWLLQENADNAEHAVYEFTKDQPKLHNSKLLDWFAEINAETEGVLDERTRMEISKQRVHAWKVAGYYPTVLVVTKNMRSRIRNAN